MVEHRFAKGENNATTARAPASTMQTSLDSYDKIEGEQEPKTNTRFSGMVSHYLFKAKTCNPASG